jgi:EAL domain-containing protein (putative c-di-GMP-specific phosphodiesterase class I)
VHIGQGYLLSRPLRAAQIVELLSLATASAPA